MSMTTFITGRRWGWTLPTHPGLGVGGGDYPRLHTQ